MTSQSGNSHLPTGHQGRRKAGTAALTAPCPLQILVGGSNMKESDPTPQELESSLQPSRYDLKTGEGLGISPAPPLEIHIIFYAGKEACA